MTNKINVSFSGGQSSAYMLYILLQNYDKKDLVITFANTGKEHEKTLEFVRDIENNWGLNIVWLEMDIKEKFIKGVNKSRDCIIYKIVDFETASRNGEPFNKLIENFGLPNRAARFCSQYLKVQPIEKYLRFLNIDYKTAMGIRIDESKRARKFNKLDYIFPLIDYHVTKKDVDNFWNKQPFKLNIPNHLGNCDLCFLKAISKRRRILKDFPRIGDWWQEKEKQANSTFHNNLSVEQIAKQANSKNLKIYQKKEQLSLGFDITCFCGD